ncbi:MAG: GNAT family N-acetyltransferase [Kofleriaceae bacterium]
MIRTLRDDELAWANERYQAIEFAASPPGTFGLVAEQAGDRVALGRLVTLEPGVIELGGIWTDERVRGRGLAREIVTALIAHGGATRLWCLPFAHLAAFYESFGFVRAEPPWPAGVAAKLSACASHPIPTGVVQLREPTR